MRIKTLKLKKLSNLPKRSVYGFLAILILSSSYLWWRPDKVHAQTVFLTSTAATTWSVPSDWNNSNNKIEVIGGGGGGGQSGGGQFGGGGGGGGGGYAKVTNASLTASSSVGINVGSAGEDTYVCNSTNNCTSSADSAVIVAAGGGSSGTTATGASGASGGNGGVVIAGTGFAGGSGGNGGNSQGNNGGGGGGGGGAAGLNAAGNGATSGSAATGGAGGQGDGTFGGVGGASGNFGSNGTEWDASHGSGGGGGGNNGGGNGVGGGAGLSGSSYGGGGGGAGGDGKSITNTVGAGGGNQGLIVVTYTPLNSPPGAPTLSSPGNGSTVISTTPQFQMAATDPEGDHVEYSISIYNTSANNGSDCTGTSNQSSWMGFNPTGWSGQNADAGTTYLSGSTATYTVQVGSALSRGSSYCWQSTADDPSGSTVAGSSSSPFTFTIDSAPNAPALSAPSSGATGVSTTPTFSFSDTDPDSDDIQFKINLLQSNCSTSVATYDMASGQIGWSPTFNGTAGSGLSFISATSGSGVSYVPSSALSNSTTYCWSVSAKDPGGTNTYTTSSTRSFTTVAAGGSDTVNIQGGVNINGGSTIQ